MEGECCSICVLLLAMGPTTVAVVFDVKTAVVVVVVVVAAGARVEVHTMLGLVDGLVMAAGGRGCSGMVLM